MIGGPHPRESSETVTPCRLMVGYDPLDSRGCRSQSAAHLGGAPESSMANGPMADGRSGVLSPRPSVMGNPAFFPLGHRPLSPRPSAIVPSAIGHCPLGHRSFSPRPSAMLGTIIDHPQSSMESM